jgi:2-dehydro-3-deoxygalactonokinase
MANHVIALDWGSSQLRAVRMSARGAELESRVSDRGVATIVHGEFEEALNALCADWLTCDDHVLIASGMIGSRQGLREAPYLSAPASLPEAAASLVPVSLGASRTLWIVPGVHSVDDSGLDDVMRGEETQIWGDNPKAGGLIVLPGTHSKWVHYESGDRIGRFRTWMTGELYSVLIRHSLLGRLMQHGTDAPQAFDLGARAGLADPAAIGSLIFSVRTMGLMNRLPPEALPDYLSGLLIGAEIGAATESMAPSHAGPPQNHPSTPPIAPAATALRLIGEPLLCARYARAAALVGISAELAPPGRAARGAWRIAETAGLIE